MEILGTIVEILFAVCIAIFLFLIGPFVFWGSMWSNSTKGVIIGAAITILGWGLDVLLIMWMISLI